MFNLQKSYEELDALAAADSQAYRAHVLRLVLLGYMYLFGAVLLLVVLVGVIVFAMISFHVWIMIKLAILPLLAIVAVINSLRVKIEPPEGIEISRVDAPKLWEMIDEIRANAACPEIDKVLLNADFNCAAFRQPRFGLLGFDKTYVLVGFTLMDSLSVDQFKWVLAHELGHISNLDGRFSLWVYRVRTTWLQMLQNIAETENHLGHGLFVKFAQWYFPILETHTLVLRRAHEYAADKFAARIAGPAHGIEALLATDIRAIAVDNHYWTRLVPRFLESELPPPDIYTRYRAAMKNELPEKEALSALRLSISKHSEADSHPTLPERIKALGGNDDTDALLGLYRTAPPLQQTAAEVLFGQNLWHFESELVSQWQMNVKEYWIKSRSRLEKASAELRDFEGADIKSMHVDDLREYVVLLESLERVDEAIAALQLCENRDGDLDYELGRVLLEEKKDPAGIAWLERALETAPWLTSYICEKLYRHYKSEGDDAKVAEIEKFGTQWIAEAKKAIEEVPEASGKDTFTVPDFSPRRLKKIRELLESTSIDDAWLVSRAVPKMIGERQVTLIVKPSSKLHGLPDIEKYRDVPLIAAAPELAGVSIYGYTLIAEEVLQIATTQLPEAHIYSRKERA